jgi:hypothetical protein
MIRNVYSFQSQPSSMLYLYYKDKVGYELKQSKDKKPFRYPLAFTVGIITAILFGIAFQSPTVGLAVGCMLGIVFGTMPKGTKKEEE